MNWCRCTVDRGFVLFWCSFCTGMVASAWAAAQRSPATCHVKAP